MAEDVTAPTLTGLVVNPSVADISSGPVDVSFAVSYSDDLSGIKYVSVFAQSPAGQNLGASIWDMTEGDKLNGTISGTLTIPQFYASGDYSVTVALTDAAGNSRYVYDAEHRFGSDLNVISLHPDGAAPTLTGLVISPSVADISSGPVDVSFAVSYSDDLSGIKYVSVFAQSPAGQNLGASIWDMTEGDKLNGTISGTLTIPQLYASGDYSVTIALTDATGNSRYVYDAEYTFGSDLVVLADTNTLIIGDTAYSNQNYTIGPNIVNLHLAGNASLNVVGNHLDNQIFGNSGNNVLQGADGNDTLIGGLGNDTLDGGADIDTASYAGTSAAVTANLTITTEQGTGGAGRDIFLSIENLIGSDFSDTLVGDDNANSLRGGKGADTVIGGGGEDTIEGGPGDDSLNGGLGSDTADYSTAGGAVRINLILTTPQDTGAAGLDKLVSVENLLGTPFADTFYGNVSANTFFGGGGADSLYGWSGDDTLYGEAGDDLIIGDAGNDTVDGGAGNDRLYGGSGDDTVLGGAEADTLAGGPGVDRVDGGDGADRLFADMTADTFVFGGLSGAGDRVFNFRSGVHTLEVNAAGFGGTAGPFSFVAATGTPNPTSALQTFLYDLDDGKLLFDPDGTGAAPRVLIGQLFAPGGGAPALAATDIDLL